MLATCMEISNAIRSGDPENFISHLPVHQDGSCNGLQHYAALGRDEYGGRQVNVLPSDRPEDVYAEVSCMKDISNVVVRCRTFFFNRLSWFVSELPEKDISNVVVQCK